MFTFVSVIEILIVFIFFRKHTLMNKLGLIGLLLSITSILFVTLSPTPSFDQARIINMKPIIETFRFLKNSANPVGPILNIVFNILLFVPFSYFLAWTSKINYKILIIIGVLFSVFIELVQYFASLGRSSDIDDIIFNFVGVLLGIFLNKIFRKVKSNIIK